MKSKQVGNYKITGIISSNQYNNIINFKYQYTLFTTESM